MGSDDEVQHAPCRVLGDNRLCVATDPERPKPPLNNLPKHWTIASLAELLLDAVDRELCRKCRAAGL